MKLMQKNIGLIVLKFNPVFNLKLWILCWVVTACSSSGPGFPEITAGEVILAFGDSLTSGVSQTEGADYPRFLGDITSYKVVNAGVSGEVSQEGLNRLASVLQAHQPKLVILCHGGNDLLRRNSISGLKQNLLQMISLIRESGAEVVLLGVPSPGLFVRTHKVYQEVATEAKVFYIPDLMADILSEDKLKVDAIHPNAEGNQKIAQHLAGYFKRE
jgi:lysophospholipase L1-like esterase